jgi:dTDP-4-dehydrorhamnose reductase
MALSAARTATGCKSNTNEAGFIFMNILVFGKDGQLGKAFKDLLESLLATVPNKLNIRYAGRSECDLSDALALGNFLNQFKPKLIINASAYTAVDRAEADEDLAFAINAKAPEIMAQYAANHGGTFLHYSSDCVFDGEKYGYYLENDLRNPLGVYGKSKAAGEEAIAKAFTNFSGDAKYAIFRTSWVYGEGDNFIRSILQLAKERSVLKVVNDQYGVPTSSSWLARVSLALAVSEDFHLQKFPSGIYHAVPAGETTWYGAASLASQVALDAGISLKVQPQDIVPILAIEYPLPASRPMNSRMSTDKLRQVFEARGDMSKLDLLNQSWDLAIKAYVSHLAQVALI